MGCNYMSASLIYIYLRNVGRIYWSLHNYSMFYKNYRVRTITTRLYGGGTCLPNYTNYINYIGWIDLCFFS